MIRYAVSKCGSGCGITWRGIAGSMCVWGYDCVSHVHVHVHYIYAYTYYDRGCGLWHGRKQNHICMLYDIQTHLYRRDHYSMHRRIHGDMYKENKFRWCQWRQECESCRSCCELWHIYMHVHVHVTHAMHIHLHNAYDAHTHTHIHTHLHTHSHV